MQFIDLPIEIHFCITAYLEVKDISSLIRTSQCLKDMLDPELQLRATTHVIDGTGSVLHWAAKHDRVKLARTLLDKGIPISRRDVNGETALHHAAYYGSANVAKLLIDRGVDISSLGHFKEAALSVAAKRHQVAVLQLLIDAGADVSARNEVDSRGRTPLLTAIDAYNFRRAKANMADDTIRALLRGGADPMGTDRNLVSPLVLALDRNSFNAVCLLLGAGAYFPPDKDLTDILKRVMEWSNKPIVKILVTIGTDRNQMFTCAARYAQPYIVRYLIHAYPKSEMGDEIKNRALEAAVRRNNVQIAKALISAGARAATVITEGNKSMTLMRLAMKNRSAEMVKLLLDSGADRELRVCHSRKTRGSGNSEEDSTRHCVGAA
ncbi:hypothetical protein GX50_00760 [[Emmonsia] crescens]|uniref:Uncharacterized protein n=1 Tax=[Emmonsia] crescens TaxID=73230 RepID=A0A2B7ZIW6_9EURO|nr:hypothetical protein GX50_00760 [Emmonsia crescens]